MYKLNTLRYPDIANTILTDKTRLHTLNINSDYDRLLERYKLKYGFENLNTFSFSIDGFLSMMLKLKGEIAVSLGESHAIVEAAKLYKELGFKIDFIKLNRDGSVDIESIKSLKCDYIFVSPYVTDTFIKTSLQKIKSITDAAVIANHSVTCRDIQYTDIALLDAYKLTGFQTHSVALHNGALNEQYLGEVDAVGATLIYEALNAQNYESASKEEFIKILEHEFKDDLIFFVNPKETLINTLHFGLKNIKAREMIRTLALNDIYVTNGEGCSLGLSRPSKIIQEMGYSEDESRQAFSLSFTYDIESEEIKEIVKIIAKKYRQIRLLND